MLETHVLSDIKNIANVLEQNEANNISKLFRLKNSVPFSDRLNNFLVAFYKSNKDKFIFTSIDDFNAKDLKGTFKKHLKRYEETGKIHIWTGASNNTIFGINEINYFFRAWHDLTHIENNLGYSYNEEFIVCEIQKNELPKNWILERDLIHAEIIGQGLYNFYNSGQFVKNQRTFTLNYLLDPITTLKTCQ